MQGFFRSVVGLSRRTTIDRLKCQSFVNPNHLRCSKQATPWLYQRVLNFTEQASNQQSQQRTCSNSSAAKHLRLYADLVFVCQHRCAWFVIPYPRLDVIFQQLSSLQVGSRDFSVQMPQKEANDRGKPFDIHGVHSEYSPGLNEYDAVLSDVTHENFQS